MYLDSQNWNDCSSIGWSPDGFVASSAPVVWSSWPVPSSEPILDGRGHGVPNDGMSDASEGFASFLRTALTTPGGASLRIPRGLYRFDMEFEVIVAGVDGLGSRIVNTAFPITYEEALAVGFKVPADAPPHERPRGEPYECKRAAFISSWTSDDEDYGIAADGMTDDAVAFGLLLMKAGEACPSFALDFPRGMYRFDSDIEVWIAPSTTAGVLDGISFASGDRILLTDQTNAHDNGVWVCGEQLTVESTNP